MTKRSENCRPYPQEPFVRENGGRVAWEGIPFLSIHFFALCILVKERNVTKQLYTKVSHLSVEISQWSVNHFMQEKIGMFMLAIYGKTGIMKTAIVQKKGGKRNDTDSNVK